MTCNVSIVFVCDHRPVVKHTVHSPSSKPHSPGSPNAPVKKHQRSRSDATGKQIHFISYVTYFNCCFDELSGSILHSFIAGIANTNSSFR